jgi:minichromosome maintenance protein 10
MDLIPSKAGRSAESQWPPRSPHEALLSTPGGRERLRRMAERMSTSPSPIKITRTTPALSSRPTTALDMLPDEEEDEEMLQLKLQEIQARLKLKKIQNARAKMMSEDDGAAADVVRPESVPLPQASALGRAFARAAEREARPASQNTVEVPASPARRVQPPQQHTSPTRVLLGIDKGLRGKDVSLKKAPSLRKPMDNADGKPSGGYLKRARTPNPGDAQQFEEISRPLSFNERLASARSEEASLHERRERIQRIRTNAFGIDKKEMEQFKSRAVEIPNEPIRAPSFNREEVLGMQKNTSGGLRRSNTVPSLRTQSAAGNTSLDTSGSSKSAKPAPETQDMPAFESYSTLHLSKRILPHPVLARHVSGKKVYKLKDLLGVVTSPDYMLPDIEQDIVVFAILAKKSQPLEHQHGAGRNGSAAEKRNKYMRLTLVDLKYEVDLFLFNSAFTRYWKLTEGTVIAILNPTIMPPPPSKAHSGQFSMVINSDEDSVMEIGTARDLGFCKSITREGKQCNSWVNIKRTEHCEFHSNAAVNKKQAGRMEVNMTGFGGDFIGSRKFNSKVIGYKPAGNKKAAPKRNGGTYDHDSQSHWFVSKSMSAADLIDGVDNAPRGLTDMKDKEEALKRRLKQQEKEREMVKKLGQIGTGAGREYMRYTHSKNGDVLNSSMSSSTLVSSSDQAPQPLDAKSLGLLGARGKGMDIRLSPIKRKRLESANSTISSKVSSSTTSTTTTFGWGNALKDKLARMKDGEKLMRETKSASGDRSPVRKKTRFITEKGIREAGRESLGTELSPHRQRALAEEEEDDDDDDLIIVR